MTNAAPGAEDPSGAGDRAPASASAVTRLVVVIAATADANRLLDRLAERQILATKLASSGGFLRRGNVTVISGVPEDQVDDVIALARQECRARRELVPVQSLPFFGDPGAAVPVQVRVGGATIFVLDVLRYEQT